ncbi:preprotein translocase subunit YajC [Mesonia mobilis]|uniref:Sec translocon accessory complex subunit YajC n=1 Tax=Mesonia mobilis TaxID=369791 RepID=A0ABQ3BPE3_9FLAO|nr:preprotein translocase subunit YajC [Mesonia mobilis]MBQ0738125.1 preprotein translocase subunit YajC [Aquimarina celericrescens]GGZ53038.1 preprotein translocase subunit YajC [Mesonia mobilis]
MESLMGLWPFLAIFAVFYFFMIRPQMKRQKSEKNFAEELKRGDKVVTKSGMHGKIADFSEKLNAVILETGAGKITFDKSSISMELSQALNKPKDEKEKK